MVQLWLVANAGQAISQIINVLMALLQLDLKMNNDKGEGDTSTFVLNGEWHLLGNKATQRKNYQNCPIYVF